MSSNDLDYLKAVTSTDSIFSPAIGLSRPVEAESAQRTLAKLQRQNNTIIELLIIQSRRIRDLEAKISELENKEVATGSGQDISADILKRLDNLTVS